jgi:transcriptional regulator with XRE-family HTH domain
MNKPLTPAQVKAKRIALGKALAALRKPTGDTQQQVADRAGLSRPPVYEMETGSTAYRVDSLIQLCHAHGVDLAKVLGQP